jgi:hypothetical protein
MTIARLLPLHVHGAFEAALAIALMVAPFVFGFGLVAAIASVVIGALLLAVALATHLDDRPAIPISTHATFDVAFALALSISALASGFAGDVAAAASLGSGAFALIVLASLTRYSPAHA